MTRPRSLSAHNAKMPTTVNTPDAPAALGPYSQAIRDGNLLWCSGQLGIDPSSGELTGDDMRSQCQQAMCNLDAVCREAGTSNANALRLTIYVTDLNDFGIVNEIYAGYFEAPYPARACVQVAALPKGGIVEIDAVVSIR